jgi:tetratricopeptide (TPR) repeat protein
MKKIFLLVVMVLAVTLLAGGIRKKDKALELWKALDRKGDMAFQAHKIEKACQSWQKAVKENPDNLKIYNKLGISYLLLKDYHKAIDILEKGLSIDSKNVGLNYNLALAYYYSDDNEKALEWLEAVLNLNRFYPEANFLKGLCLENIGKVEDARAAYMEELNNNPGSRRAWQKVKTEL